MRWLVQGCEEGRPVWQGLQAVERQGWGKRGGEGRGGLRGGDHYEVTTENRPSAERRKTWVPGLIPPQQGCAPEGQFLPLSGPQIPHPYNGHGGSEAL